MSSPVFDFSPLTPEERIQLAEELWDCLEPSAVPLTPELAHAPHALLFGRRAPEVGRYAGHER